MISQTWLADGILADVLQGHLHVPLHRAQADHPDAQFEQAFGGGGHRKAAGFQMPGDMRVDEVFDDDPDLEFFEDETLDEMEDVQNAKQEEEE